ncbi:MAG: methyltransferase domain-containing protein [Halobacteriota archaeon]|uniref:methyltransferase domain-containing protein n=1 Tax=Natronomonas sp. TaxID=2184060 RepID=UPI00397629CD
MSQKTTVDTNLRQREGEWVFDESVAGQFDEHVRKSIPLYDEIQTRVVKLSEWFLKSEGEERVYDLGCATGTTIERLLERHGADAPPKFVGIDLQAPMLEKARERVGHEDAVNILQADISTHMSFPNASLVISLFTLSFIREEQRKSLLEQIYDDLEYGGALIFCEKTRAQSPFFQDIWNEEYWDFKAEQGLEDEQILGKAKTLRGQLRPLTVEEYERLLADVGFDVENDVDVFFKWFPWTGIIARKGH